MEYSHILLYQSHCTKNTHAQNHYFDLFSCTFVLPVLTHLIRGCPDSSAGKESACNAGDPGLIPGLGRSPGDRKGYPLQYSGLQNSIDWFPGGSAGKESTCNAGDLGSIPGLGRSSGEGKGYPLRRSRTRLRALENQCGSCLHFL